MGGADRQFGASPVLDSRFLCSSVDLTSTQTVTSGTLHAEGGSRNREPLILASALGEQGGIVRAEQFIKWRTIEII
jgi:hypothetical protein